MTKTPKALAVLGDLAKAPMNIQMDEKEVEVRIKMHEKVANSSNVLHLPVNKTKGKEKATGGSIRNINTSVITCEQK